MVFFYRLSSLIAATAATSQLDVSLSQPSTTKTLSENLLKAARIYDYGFAYLRGKPDLLPKQPTLKEYSWAQNQRFDSMDECIELRKPNTPNYWIAWVGASEKARFHPKDKKLADELIKATNELKQAFESGKVCDYDYAQFLIRNT